MFTGIIENTGIVHKVQINGSNKIFWIKSALSNKLKIDQSLSHSGVCLTIEEIKEGMHRVTAIEETLLKTNLGQWGEGTLVNLERCLQMNGRIDGHIVQGHVDTVAQCVAIIKKEGSWQYTFRFNKKFAALIIEKGSVCVNGISLTCFNIGHDNFTVALIPYTFEHTNIYSLKINDCANIEFDVVGKYVERMMAVKSI